jgi:hypothetical protein
MVRRYRFKAILALPFAAILFLVGWGLYKVGSHKTARKVTLKPEKQDVDGIEFVIMEPETKKVTI